MKIEQVHRSRVDDDGTTNDRANNRLQMVIRSEATQRGDRSTALLPDDGKGKSLRFIQDDAAKARTKALQDAVSQGVRQAQLHFQEKQQRHPHQTSVVHWERFFPQHQLQVLLVEDDDSTRQIVSALLRNCSYEVTSAANGLLAWELLMDQNNHVDLVLTEVVMPCLSGVGLLGRIMSHEAIKHIPVIMMSSHDSMNVVFKCLSKGAADFLVKPVRKNELKNLWQHVWRRCHSSSGSRSFSGSQTQKTSRPNLAVNMNDSGSNVQSDKTSSEVNLRGGSDNGSGTQTPWTNGALEVESCHQSVKMNGSDPSLHTATHPEDGALPRAVCHEERGVAVTDTVLVSDMKLSKSKAGSAAKSSLLNNSAPTHETEAASSAEGHRTGKVDLVGVTYTKEQDSSEEQQAESEDEDELLEKHASNSPSSKDKNLSDSSSPSLLESSNLLELSLKRPREGEEDDGERGSRGGLIHSYASAFSRYNNGSNFTPVAARSHAANIHSVQVGCSSRMVVQGTGDESCRPASVLFASQKEKVSFPKGPSEEAMALHISGRSNRLDSLHQTFSPTNKGDCGPPSLPPVPGPSPSCKQPVFPAHSHAMHWEASSQVSESNDAKDIFSSYKHESYVYSHASNYPQVHHHSHHHHYHHHVQHHYHHLPEDKASGHSKTPQLNDETVTDLGSGAPRCGSSNMVTGLDGNVGPSGSNGHGSNHDGAVSVNGSGTGSNNGSKNGVQSAAALLPNCGNMETNAQVKAENGVTDTNGGPDGSRFARREAALIKFRQKRKERCFEKKVRYHSRKRLAEQRPRVRGQFVKQTLYGSTAGEHEQAN